LEEEEGEREENEQRMRTNPCEQRATSNVQKKDIRKIWFKLQEVSQNSTSWNFSCSELNSFENVLIRKCNKRASSIPAVSHA
jgi:hypothetical protein